ncbi:MAG: preprotein translocase subunit SecA [Pseudonocardiales bacterium]|nr:MAG: preprotein translocase subunit SecA [Pseudonocardiales bacterium]
MVLAKILRAGEGKILRRLGRIADNVNAVEPDYLDLSDAELRAMTEQFKDRLGDGETLDELLPEAFAVVREAAKRTIGQRHFDVQVMGGAAMHLGNVAEMKTGEGKTLVATMPVYLNALAGNGVHLVTVNDYLAKYQAEWMGRIYRFLGLTVGVILANESPDHRRAQYACDVTYGTNNEFGFDFLRDNMAWSSEELVQRGHSFAIVDEVDSILIDEARTPLIISGPAEQSARWYTEFARIAPMLVRDVDYETEEGKRTVAITETGVEKVEDQLGIDNLYEAVNTPLVGYLNNAMKARELYKRDRDYIVTAGEVLIVDEFTGRVLHGRRYNEGMHQAIEAKEGVQIKEENQTLATITLQNYFRLYKKLAGMTGTAMTEAAELHQTYKIGVVPIPTNQPMIRADHPDVIYMSEQAKFAAVVEDIATRHRAGQPMLIGTASVAKSELLSGLLLRRGIPHEVLNAKYHEKEAGIVAQAGHRGSVTVATNMAGRGTDIMLGGNPEFMADADLRARGLSPADTPEEYEAAWEEAVDTAKKKVAADHDEVAELGGMYVLGTERHEARRIDNQLRGRSGRQGDPGESRFYLSLGDDLMQRFNAHAVEAIMTRLSIPDDEPIESKMVTRAIRSAQTQVEQQNFEIRKNVLKYDEVMNIQRGVIYGERKKVLEGADLHEQVRHFIDDVVKAYVDGETAEGYPEDWDLTKLWTALKTLYPVRVTVEDVIKEAGGELSALTHELLVTEVTADAQAAYNAREEEVGAEVMRELERRVVLSVLDRKWREHLYEMDYLQEGIHLRAMAQRDPLVEYKREGFEMFAAMQDGIKEESIGYLFNIEVQVEPEDGDGPAAGVDGASVPRTQVSAAAGRLAAKTEIAAGAEPAVDAAPAAPTPAASGPSAASGSPAASSNGASARPAARRSAAPSARRTPTPPAEGTGLPAGRQPLAKGLDAPRQPAARLQYSAPSLDGAEEPATANTTTVTGSAEPSRNAPCPCGSGKKYKKCHGAPTAS